MKKPLLLLALAACNQVFGLQETTGPDSDGDHVPDDDDNCPLLVNADQADRDHDGFGDTCDPCIDGRQSGLDGDHDDVDDACDSCLTGANHDEDQDGLGDGCDPCPADPTDGPDTDGDGIGDACDPYDGPSQRVFFDGFGPPSSGWRPLFSTWAPTDDGYVPVNVVAQGARTYHPDTAVSADHFQLLASIVLPAAPVGSAVTTFNLQLITQAGGNVVATCQLLGMNGKWVLNPASAGMLAIAAGPETLRLFPKPTGGGGFSISCEVAGDRNDGNGYGNGLETYLLQLGTNGTTSPPEVQWVDVIQ